MHTEDIALKCYELLPQSFSWVKHPQYPDKDVVRVALTDARKEQYGALVEGRSGQRTGQPAKTSRDRVPDGWILTPRGMEWVRSNLDQLNLLADSGQVKEHRQKVLRQVKRIKDHKLYEQYIDDPSQFHPMIGEIADLLRCRVDAEPDIWDKRFESVRRQAMAAEQAEVLDFIDKCIDAYSKQR